MTIFGFTIPVWLVWVVLGFVLVVVFVVVVSVVVPWVISRLVKSQDLRGALKSLLDSPLGAVSVMVVTVALAATVLGLVAGLLKGTGLGLTLVMPILAVIGVLLLIATLVAVVAAFKQVGLADKEQALGLPDGSVRALLALSLLVLFAILSVFIYTSLTESARVRTIENATNYQIDDLRRQHPDLVVSAIRDSKGDIVPGIVTLSYTEGTDPASNDFARQLLTLLGTLLTAVTSFYFGANTVSSAVADSQPPNPAAPAPTKATPTDVTRPKPDEKPLAQKITVLGTNLNDVISASLDDGHGATIKSDGLPESNAGQVSFTVTLTSASPTGSFDIVLTDKNGRTGTLAHAVRIA
jgi:hypothetical protein